MTLKALYQLILGTSLVTLGGCETDRSRVETGDELIGISNAFLAVGAQSLPVSLGMTVSHQA